MIIKFAQWLKESELAAGYSMKLPKLPDAQWQGAPGGSGTRSYEGDPIIRKKSKKKSKK